MVCELSPRIVPSDGRCDQYRKSLSQSCRVCGSAILSEVMPLSEDMKNQFRGDLDTVASRRGAAVTPAAELAVKYFESINSHLDGGGSWITICNLIKQATGAVFDHKSLRKWFDIESKRRGLPVRQLLQGCPKSRENKIAAMKTLTQTSRSAAAHSVLSVSSRSASPLPSHQVGKETVHHPVGGGYV